jgi:NAD(P)-dependent dehydrogenase (short-subunit alcohol dehydrogenase family)
MSMKEKTVVVTGANTGIGFETALALAKKGAQVIIVARSPGKSEATAARIKELSLNEHVDYYVFDLSSQKQIRTGCAEMLKHHGRIDVLINNAGTWFSKLILTEDGIEMQLAVHHVAPFLMTHLLLPALSKSDDARVISVNSDSHFHGTIHFDDLNLIHNYHGLRSYAQSKLANVMFTYEFERRKPEKNPAIHAVQPGLVKTDIGLKHTNPLHALAWKVRRMGGVSAEKGAATSVFLATGEEGKTMSGLYWDKCKPKPSSAQSYITADAERLWEISEKITGINDYFRPSL